MKIYEFEGKKLEDLICNSLEKLNLKNSEVYIYTSQISKNILKKDYFKIKIVKLDDIGEYIKNYLKNFINKMSIDVNFESNIQDSLIYIRLLTNNNALLIGKQGKTLTALTTIVKQMLNTKFGINPHIILDVENYRNNRDLKLERLANKIADEVLKTKMDIKLHPLNSYERRIIHNALANKENIITNSEGKEPNRCVVIKYRA